MKKQLKKAAATAAAVLAVSATAMAPASAAACVRGTVAEVEAGPAKLYLIHITDANVPDWIYAENNGIPGLQRGGKHGGLPLPQSVDSGDPCNDGGTPDLQIY
ncbi:MAG TPA: hypothetical protein VNE62_11295 [Actinomycetota bacterium]|nr:hypothetical protein [Actinomycetota bacterium]